MVGWFRCIRLGSAGVAGYLVAMLFSSPTFGFSDADLENMSKALTMIADFSDRECALPLETTNHVVGLSGKAKAELNGLFKSVADLGFEGSAAYFDSDANSGLLQADVLEAVKNNSSCKLKILDILKSRLLSENQPTLGERLANFNLRCDHYTSDSSVGINCPERVCTYENIKISGQNKGWYQETVFALGDISNITAYDDEVVLTCAVGDCIRDLRYRDDQPPYDRPELKQEKFPVFSILYSKSCAKEFAEILQF